MFYRAAKNRHVATAWDVERLICDEMKTKSFDELQVGPFCAFPQIRKLFGLRVGLDATPRVTGEEVVSGMFKMAREQRGRIESPKAFLDWFAKKRRVDVRDLGISLRRRGISGTFHANKVLRNHQKDLERNEEKKRKKELEAQSAKIRERLTNESREASNRQMCVCVCVCVVVYGCVCVCGYAYVPRVSDSFLFVFVRSGTVRYHLHMLTKKT